MRGGIPNKIQLLV